MTETSILVHSRKLEKTFLPRVYKSTGSLRRVCNSNRSSQSDPSYWTPSHVLRKNDLCLCQHAQYVTIFSNCGKFHLVSKFYGVTRSYPFLCALAFTYVFCRASSRHFLFWHRCIEKTESKTACISQKSVSGLICQENDFAHVPIKQQSLTLPLYTL